MIAPLTLAKVDSIRAMRHFRRSSDVGVSLFSFSSPKSNSLKPESGIEYGVSGISESSFDGDHETTQHLNSATKFPGEMFA